MSWITIKTTLFRAEAELMQQILADHDIPSRVLDTGLGIYGGQSGHVALQVRSQDRWTALFLLSPQEDSL